MEEKTCFSKFSKEDLINHILEYKSDTMKLDKTYKAEKNSASFGQVIYCPYDYDKVRLIVKKMTD